MSAPPSVPDDVDSSVNAFWVYNSNNIACNVQRVGAGPVTVAARSWSPQFTVHGRYDVFIAATLIQYTVHFEGGGANIVPGQGGGNYVVYTTLI